MKANEVMLGDWVSYKGKMPCKITAICKDMAVVDNDTTQDWGIDYDKLTPIPLTEEILEKNGFKCEEIIHPHWISEDGRILFRNDESLIDSNNKWSVHIGTEDGSTIGYFEITHVHELQHARYVGEEYEFVVKK